MPLNEVNNHALDDVFANELLDKTIEKYTFPNNESNPEAAYQLVSDELILDGNSRQNLATFCQTCR
ncbi:glutamate decarboxylase [Vibrio maritimus]|uniref:glutamate decarboxylase n=1 Tax=Vibrio maritimus TaxID=990268 RepID=A0A090T7B6_9VIBR|nr:glutamate decarboxylase [Vibrio maritimus]